MNNIYFISVIVPNYNHAKYLDQRIQSILNQTYLNFELIILDDCSPDDGASRKVIEQYRGNPHVSHIVYNEENSGSTFKQWDKGINLAKGELIWIAESDDYCEPTLLERLVAEFKKDDRLTLAYSLSRLVNADGQAIKCWCYTPSKVTRINGNDYVVKYMTMGNHCNNASACLFKKTAYQNIDKLYTTYKAGGDKLFWIEIAEQGNVAIINTHLNYFRQHNHKVTPLTYAKGINLTETKKTYEHILAHHQLSSRRKQWMLLYILHRIERSHFESEIIRKELLRFWGCKPSLSIIDKIQLGVIIKIRKFNIYI